MSEASDSRSRRTATVSPSVRAKIGKWLFPERIARFDHTPPRPVNHYFGDFRQLPCAFDGAVSDLSWNRHTPRIASAGA